MTLPRWALLAIGAISLFRLIVASQIPLNEDEAYYWSLSLHPAYGYTEHPPMVAWLIALGAFAGKSAIALRLPFIICEAVAAIAVGYAAMILSENEHAGGVAAVMLAGLEQPRWIIGETIPDGPYVACWALTLCFVARLQRRPTWLAAVLLGLALGGALLSRFFAWALVAGLIGWALVPARRGLWRNGLWLALLIALAVYAPFIAWNAAHHWENFAFTFGKREAFGALSVERLTTPSTVRFLVFASPFSAFLIVAALRSRVTLPACTGLPLIAVLIVLSFSQTTESYYLLGPFGSLCAAAGMEYERWQRGWRVLWRSIFTVAVPISMAFVALMASPEPMQAAILRASPGSKGAFYSGAYAYLPLAEEVQRIAQRRSAAVLTDRAEIAGELLLDGVDDPLLVGTQPHVPQWRRWFDPSAHVPPRAVLVTFAPLRANRDLSVRIARAYAHVAPGPTLRATFAGAEARTLSITFCESPRSRTDSNLFGG